MAKKYQDVGRIRRRQSAISKPVSVAGANPPYGPSLFHCSPLAQGYGLFDIFLFQESPWMVTYSIMHLFSNYNDKDQTRL